MLLGEIQNAVATADEAICSVGRSLGLAQSACALDSESNSEIRLYVENLNEMKSFLIYLHAYAETRRKELRKDAGKFSQFTAWAETVKLTLAAPE
ncbi:MAG: hypothetical protein KGM47_08565 [Acidobacteriota bacterium]|nr:hypothetical protein [Acidobacteriota bacterium]